MICFRAIFRRRVESHRGDLMLRHLAFVLKFFNLIFFSFEMKERRFRADQAKHLTQSADFCHLSHFH